MRAQPRARARSKRRLHEPRTSPSRAGRRRRRGPRGSSPPVPVQTENRNRSGRRRPAGCGKQELGARGRRAVAGQRASIASSVGSRPDPASRGSRPEPREGRRSSGPARRIEARDASIVRADGRGNRGSLGPRGSNRVSRRRSPSPTRRAARSAIAASTSRTWSARCPSRRSGDCWSTAASSPACRPPSRTRSRCAPATRAPTSRPRSRCWRPEWGLQELIDISDEQARDDLARCRSWRSPSSRSRPAASAGRPCRRRRSTRPPRSPSAS